MWAAQFIDDPPVRLQHAKGVAEPRNTFTGRDGNGAITGNPLRHHRRPVDDRAVLSLARAPLLVTRYATTGVRSMIGPPSPSP